MTATENNQPDKNISDRKYIFGPVPSRRLGGSRGIDLVPFKTCTYDCIYCQLGKTTNKTIQRKEWVSLDEIMSQLKDKLCLEPDYILDIKPYVRHFDAWDNTISGWIEKHFQKDKN